MVWAGLAFVAILIWVPQLRYHDTGNRTVSLKADGQTVWRSKIAWQVTFFMGIQSFLFYCTIAWLPEILRDWGMAPEKAGWLLSYIQIAQLPVVFGGPVIAARMKNQTPLIWITCIALVGGLSGVIFGKTALILPSAILIGIALGLAFSLAMIFLSLRTRDSAEASALSGMSQSVGYLFAAAGPVVFGLLHDVTNGWTYSLVFLLILAVALLLSGLGSAKARYV